MGQQLGHNKFVENALKYGFSLWGLPKTGQTTKYRTGDDGDFEKGYPGAPPRFKDNGDGTITDNATGLMWVQEPAIASKNWNAAVDYCLGLNHAGHTDWRLPNIIELLSIITFDRHTPALDTTFFLNAISGYHWSSTTYIIDTNKAWLVQTTTGAISAYAKVNTIKTRAVRLGVPKD